MLLLWAAGLALLARRELLTPATTRLAEAALRVQPSVHYYVVERDGEVVGGGTAEVDTTGYAMQMRQHLFGKLVEGDTAAITISARTLYSPRLALGSLRITLERNGDSLSLSARRDDDSMLVVNTGGLGVAASESRVPGPDPVFTPPLAALPLLLLNEPRPGAAMTVRIFDPVLREIRELPLRITAESLFVVVDSAAFDPARRRWTMARRDTVRAWRVGSVGTNFTAWVDRAGAIVEASDGRGTVARRSAYEIAYENWRLSRATAVPGNR